MQKKYLYKFQLAENKFVEIIKKKKFILYKII